MGAGQQTDGARPQLEGCGSWEEVGEAPRRERGWPWQGVLEEGKTGQRAGATGGEMVGKRINDMRDRGIKLDTN